ncbi:MAG: hypothetical protein IKF42_06315 [Mogibacterium sp.]|nr:hypothetical protein [Mogibacterium sp.]
MEIDEAIKRCEEVAEENQKVVDTGIVFDDVTIDMLYCDDTEVIDEHLANYQRCANEQRQLAEWLKDYKRLLEQPPILDEIRAEIKKLSPTPTAEDVIDGNEIKEAVWEILADVLKIIDKYKAERED